MTNNYQRKPVNYNGTTYKSTLEGKFAVLLDNLGAKWEYEPFEENGYKVDFVVHNVYKEYYAFTGQFEEIVTETSDLYVETKGYMYLEASDKIERFVEQGFHIIVANYIQIQDLKNWEVFVKAIKKLSITPISGDNVQDYCAYSYSTIDGAEHPAVLVVLNDGRIALTDFEDNVMTKVDKGRTLKAYNDAFRRTFEDETEVLKDQLKLLEKKAKRLEREHELRKESKSLHFQLLMRPSTKQLLKERADELKTSMGDLITALIEDYLWE